MYVLCMKVPISVLNLALIRPIVQKWQPFFEIQDDGDRHLEFLQLNISDVIDMFQIKVPMLPLILVTIGQIVKKGRSFSKSKMAAATILNYGYLDFSTSPMCSKSKNKIPTKFEND